MRLKTRFACLTAVAMAASWPSAAPQNLLGVQVTQPGHSSVSQRVVMSINKSTVIELDRPAADVVITNPAIADAAVQTTQRIIFRGVSVGQTNAFIFDQDGNQILNLEIAVERDLGGLQDLIVRHVPDARVQVEAVNDNVILTGVVDSLSQQDQVMRLAQAYIGAEDDANLVNMTSVSANDQVLLRVKVVEMKRSIVKQLGINLSGDIGFGELASESVQDLFVFDPVLGTLVNALDADGNPVTTLAPAAPFERSVGVDIANGFPVAGSSLGGLSTDLGFSNFVGSTPQSSGAAAIDALERVGIVRTLAEPNMTALSGETANFLAGGEFPVPVGQDTTGRITVAFRPFGVGLAFTPIVLSEGRISLKLSTEVSELSTVGGLTGTTTTTVDAAGNIVTLPGLTIPALVVRRAETTVELPSGGSMMIAGLIQSETRQTIDSLPGVKQLPILGALFRSRDFLNEETELVIIVTPYLVDPAKPGELRTPADGFVNASDLRTVLFGKLNTLYGKPGADANAQDYQAPVGFIEE